MATHYKYVCLFPLLLLSIALRAQVQYGVAAGLCFYKPSITYAAAAVHSSTLMNYAPVVGGFVYVPLTKHFFLRPSMDFAFRAVKEKRLVSGNNFTTTSDPVTFLDLLTPLLWFFKTGTGKVYIGAGPGLNFLDEPSYRYSALSKTDIGPTGNCRLRSGHRIFGEPAVHAWPS